MFSIFSKFNRTHFHAGGLLSYQTPLCRMMEKNFLKTAADFQAPRKIDNRDMCLASNNQGNVPRCAGYATAGYCEFQHWKNQHYPKQFDADAIYLKAKTIDGIPHENGTYLWAAIKAATELNLIKGEGRTIQPKKLDVQFAIHQYGVCIAGFMITEDWNYVEKTTGIIKNTPGAGKIGGHAVLIAGYDSEGFYIQNSWSADWGICGFGIIGYDQFSSQIMSTMVVA